VSKRGRDGHRSEGADRSHAPCGRTNPAPGLGCGRFFCHRAGQALLAVQGVAPLAHGVREGLCAGPVEGQAQANAPRAVRHHGACLEAPVTALLTPFQQSDHASIGGQRCAAWSNPSTLRCWRPARLHPLGMRWRRKPESARNTVRTPGHGGRSPRTSGFRVAAAWRAPHSCRWAAGRRTAVAGHKVQRVVAVTVAVPVEEATLLLAVQRVVGGVDVQHQRLGRDIEAGRAKTGRPRRPERGSRPKRRMGAAPKGLAEIHAGIPWTSVMSPGASLRQGLWREVLGSALARNQPPLETKNAAGWGTRITLVKPAEARVTGCSLRSGCVR